MTVPTGLGAASVEVHLVEGELDHISAIQEIELDAGTRFADVGLATIAEAPPTPVPELAAAISGGRLLLAVLDDGDTVGYVKWSIVDTATHIDQVSVRRRAAGRAIGRLLMDRVCDIARSRGDEKVTLTTFTTIAWNGPLYERYGFEIVHHDDMSPELEALRRAETEAGLDVLPRAAMQHPLIPTESTSR